MQVVDMRVVEVVVAKKKYHRVQGRIRRTSTTGRKYKREEDERFNGTKVLALGIGISSNDVPIPIITCPILQPHCST